MSTAAVIAIVIGAVVVLGALSFFTMARRSDVRGAGALSGETLQRDRRARGVPVMSIAPTPLRGAVIVLAAAVAGCPATVEPAGPGGGGGTGPPCGRVRS